MHCVCLAAGVNAPCVRHAKPSSGEICADWLWRRGMNLQEMISLKLRCVSANSRHYLPKP